MKNVLIISLCLFLNISFAQKDNWQTKYEQRWEHYDGGTKLFVSNNNFLPITYKIGYKPVNLVQDVENGSYIVIPGRTKDSLLLDFKKIDPKKKWKFNKGSTLVYLGDLTDTEYDEDYVYELPFEKGTSHKISQGYN